MLDTAGPTLCIHLRKSASKKVKLMPFGGRDIIGTEYIMTAFQPADRATLLNENNKQMKICTTCGYKNPEHVANCLHCTAPLASTCSMCQSPYLAGSKFCSECGAKLPATGGASAEQAATQVQQRQQALMPKALGQKLSCGANEIFGESREVTVLFVSLRTLSDGLADPDDDEELYFIRDEVMKLLGQIVEKYEGSIDKFTADGLVALFGAPTAHENDPERAIRAALEMQESLISWQFQLQEESGFEFSSRFGLHTGTVIAGAVGSDLHMEYTVVGDAVQQAKQLEAMAATDEILISETTYKHVRPLCECMALPVVQDGSPTPPKPYSVRRLLTDRTGEPDKSVLRVTMVGRANELKKLQKTFRTVCDQTDHRMVLVTGEAGLGKSRLVSEFRQTLSVSTAQVFEGSCLTYTRAVALGVVANLLRDMLAVTEATPPQLQQQRLHAYLERLDIPNGHEIYPYLLQVLGLEHLVPGLVKQLQFLDAAMLQRQTHAALRQVLLAQAQAHPTILIFEDLQWLDSASKDFLEYIIETIENTPLLILLVSRGAERRTALNSLVSLADRSPDRWLDLQLSPLSEAEANSVVDQLVGNFSTEARQVKQKIVERAEGNPLFIEEMMQMLIDRGGLNRDLTTGAWQIAAGQIDLLQTIPGTIKGLMMARIDSLPEGMRRTLQKAAVLGPTFAVEVLQQINDLPTVVTGAQLEEMVNRHFLLPQDFRSTAGYTFRHKLLQETIYSSLIKRNRRQIHTQVARAVENSTLWLPDERAEALAYHYGESDFPLMAVPYLLIAGENALRRCAYETAIDHYRRAVMTLSDQEDDSSNEYFRSQLGLATGLKFIGELTEAGQILTELLVDLRQSSLSSEPATLQPILIESLRQIADVRQREGIYDSAQRHLLTGLQLLISVSESDSASTRHALLERIAWIHFRQGQLDKAQAVAQRVLDEINPNSVKDPIILASLYNTMGGIAWQQNRLDDAIERVKQSLQLYDGLGYYYGTAVGYGNLGILYYQQGNWPKASHYYEIALSMHQMIGNRDGQAVSLDNWGILYLAMGQHDKAQVDLEAALTIRQQLGDQWGVAQTHSNLAQLALVQGNIADSAQHAQSALSMSENIDSKELRAEALWITALVCAEQNELHRGINKAQQSLRLAREAGLVQQEAHSLRVLGRLHHLIGDSDQHAISLLQQALTLGQRRNDPYLEGLVLVELAHLYQTGDQAIAKACLKKAAARFERIGAAGWFQTVQTALA